MSCSRRSTARRRCLAKSGGTWALYSASLLSVAEVIGYLKGKSSIWIAQNVERKVRNFPSHKFWGRGYFVSTVGRNEEMIRAYMKNQEMADNQLDQLQLKRSSS
jgi:putative transposase